MMQHSPSNCQATSETATTKLRSREVREVVPLSREDVKGRFFDSDRWRHFEPIVLGQAPEPLLSSADKQLTEAARHQDELVTRRYLAAIGLQPGDRFMLVHGRGYRQTAIGTIGSFSKGLLSASFQAAPKKNGYKPVTAAENPYPWGSRLLPAVLPLGDLCLLAEADQRKRDEQGPGTGDLAFLQSLQFTGRSLDAIERPSPLIIAEIDNISLADQKERWTSFFCTTGLTPLGIYHSGKKSFHVHFFVPGIATLEDWQRIQGKLTARLLADPAMNKPSQPIRLPGVARYHAQLNKWVTVQEVWLDADAVYAPQGFEAALDRTWPYAQPYSPERFALYAATQIKLKPGMASTVDAFNAAPTEFAAFLGRRSVTAIASTHAPRQLGQKNTSTTLDLDLTRTKSDHAHETFAANEDNNPWTTYLDTVIQPALAALPIEQQYLISGYNHNFQQEPNGSLAGCSPWSPTNSSGGSFKVNPDGEWYCWASSRGGRIRQYLQLYWYERSGRDCAGAEFREFVTRLAAALNLVVPEFPRAKPVRKTFAQHIESLRLAGAAESKPTLVSDKGASDSLFLSITTDATAATTVTTATKPSRITPKPGDKAVCSARLSDSLEPGELFSSDNPVIGLVSPTGSGKTHAVNHAIGEIIKAEPSTKVFCLFHRRGNARGAASRLNRDTGHGVFLNEIGVIALEQNAARVKAGLLGTEQVLTLCLDSIHKIIKNAREAAIAGHRIIVFADEWEALVNHLLLGSTIKGRRAGLLEQFKSLLNLAVRSGGGIVAADAYFSNRGREFLDFAAGFKSRLIINNSPDVTHPIYWHSPFNIVKGDKKLLTDGNLRHQAFQAVVMLLEAGKRVAIPTDCQTVSEQLAGALKEKFPNINILRIDRKTANDPDVIDCFADPNRFLAENKIDVMVFSPTMGEGVSIDIAHFDAQVLIAGHLGPDRQLQAIKRVRCGNPTLPTHVFCNQRGFGAPNPTSVESLLEGEQRRFATIVAASGVDEIAGPGAQRAINEPTPWLQFAARAAAELEHEQALQGVALAESLRTAFVQDGWEIQDLIYEAQYEDFSENGEKILPMAEAKKRIQEREAEQRAAALLDYCTPETARHKMTNDSITWEQSILYQKVLDGDRYPLLGQVAFAGLAEPAEPAEQIKADGNGNSNSNSNGVATPATSGAGALRGVFAGLFSKMRLVHRADRPLLLNDADWQLEHMIKNKRQLLEVQRLHWALNPAAATHGDRVDISKGLSSRNLWTKDVRGASLFPILLELLGAEELLGGVLHRDHPLVPVIFERLLAKADLIKASLNITITRSHPENHPPIRQILSCYAALGIKPVSTSRPRCASGKGRTNQYQMPSFQGLLEGDKGAILASLEHRWRTLDHSDLKRDSSLEKLVIQKAGTYAGQRVRYGGLDLEVAFVSGDYAHCVPLEDQVYPFTDYFELPEDLLVPIEPLEGQKSPPEVVRAA